MGSKLDALNQWVAGRGPARPVRMRFTGATAATANTTRSSRGCRPTAPSSSSTKPPIRDSWLHRSHPDDVARVEHLTFVCTSRKQDDAGPNNHWMAPAEGHAEDGCALFDGCMRGPHALRDCRTCMGPVDSPLSRCGVEITDSPVRGREHAHHDPHGRSRRSRASSARAWLAAASSRACTRSASSSPDRRFIMHFPEELAIKSFGSGYGGNALLGKKCHALRIASLSRRAGRLAGRAHADPRRSRIPQGET